MYIYIFEDGQVGYSDEGPSEIDKECIGDGILQVLEVEDGVVYDIDGDGDALELPEAVWSEADDFHVLEG